MRGISGAAFTLAGLLAVAVMGAGSSAATSAPAAPPPLAKGWGWLLAPGTAAAVDAVARTVTVAVSGEGRAEIFEGGTSWRHQVVTGTQVVHVLPATVLADAERAPVSIAAIRSGTPVLVWGVVRSDASVHGLKVLMPRLHTPPSPVQATATPSGVSGVVLRVAGGTLELLTLRGARRSVILTGATAVRANGAGYPPTAIAPHDLVNVDGTINSDGSIAATHIDVALTAAGAAQVSGDVAQSLGEVEGLIVGGVLVVVSRETYFVRGTGPAAFKQCVPGQPVTVYGSPIAVGKLPVGLRAQLIVLH